MTEPSAIWFLDVDGVINACPWEAVHRNIETPKPAWPDLRVTQVRSHGGQKRPYQIIYSPTLISLIRDLHTSGIVEVRWLTTWANGANNHLRHHLGLPELQLAGPHPTKKEMKAADGRGVWWKRAVALGAIQALAPETKVVWTDDHLVHFPILCEGLAKAGVLAIAPDDMLGLTPTNMDQILSYLETGEIAEAAA